MANAVHVDVAIERRKAAEEAQKAERERKLKQMIDDAKWSEAEGQRRMEAHKAALQREKEEEEKALDQDSATFLEFVLGRV